MVEADRRKEGRDTEAVEKDIRRLGRAERGGTGDLIIHINSRSVKISRRIQKLIENREKQITHNAMTWMMDEVDA